MKIISWNVNGIRSVLGKGFLDFVRKENPDILCLQETRANPAEVKLPLPAYRSYWNPAEKKPGYSGTAIFTKTEPQTINSGMGIREHDREGRVIAAEFDQFYLVNVYVPNSKRDLSRLSCRQQWDRDFLQFLKALETKKPVVFCGDLNVAHKEIDLTNPAANRRNHGFTDEERAGFDQFVRNGFLDAFREFLGDGGHYTWWSQMNNCRERNIGWRIDYFLISKSLRAHLKNACILPEVAGSDHCPVSLELEIKSA